MMAPDAMVLFPTLPMFSDIQAIFKGWLYGHDAATNAPKYLIETHKLQVSLVSKTEFPT